MAIARVRRSTGSCPGRAKTHEVELEEGRAVLAARRLSRSASSRPGSSVGAGYSRSGAERIDHPHRLEGASRGSRAAPGWDDLGQPVLDPRSFRPQQLQALAAGQGRGCCPRQAAAEQQLACRRVPALVSRRGPRRHAAAQQGLRDRVEAGDAGHLLDQIGGSVDVLAPPGHGYLRVRRRRAGRHAKPRASRFPVIRSSGQSTPSSRRTSAGSNSSLWASARDSPASSIPAGNRPARQFRDQRGGAVRAPSGPAGAAGPSRTRLDASRAQAQRDAGAADAAGVEGGGLQQDPGGGLAHLLSPPPITPAMPPARSSSAITSISGGELPFDPIERGDPLARAIARRARSGGGRPALSRS